MQDWKALRELTAIIRDESPTIVHTHMGKAGWIGRLAARRAGVPFIVHTYHGHTFDGYWTGLRHRLQLAAERHVAKFSTVLVAQSQSQRIEIGAALRIKNNDRIQVIEPGIDFAQLDHQATNLEAMREDFNAKGAAIVTFLGRLAPIKNCRGFLDVFSSVSKQFDGKVIALIAGGGSSDEERALKAHANNLGIEKQCRWLGFRQDVATVLDLTDVLLSTSLSEGTPLNLIEALSRGVDIVATDVGGVRDVVGCYEQATLCPVEDVPLLTKAVAARLKAVEYNDKESTTSLKVRDRFSSRRLIDATAALYRSL
jgi:glycosyltransferase involved in cell wall biosynthesis